MPKELYNGEQPLWTFPEALMISALRAAMEKAIIRLVMLDCRGLTFKPHMEKVKAEPRTKSFL